MAHTRIRPFNTRDTYPEQSLDNDLSQAVVTQGGRIVWLRGQCPQNLDDAKNIDSHDPVEQTHKVMQNIVQLIEEAGGSPSCGRGASDSTTTRVFWLARFTWIIREGGGSGMRGETALSPKRTSNCSTVPLGSVTSEMRTELWPRTRARAMALLSAEL